MNKKWEKKAKETLKEVALLSNKKASSASDIPDKIIKENWDIIAYS